MQAGQYGLRWAMFNNSSWIEIVWFDFSSFFFYPLIKAPSMPIILPPMKKILKFKNTILYLKVLITIYKEYTLLRKFMLLLFSFGKTLPKICWKRRHFLILCLSWVELPFLTYPSPLPPTLTPTFHPTPNVDVCWTQGLL